MESILPKVIEMIQFKQYNKFLLMFFKSNLLIVIGLITIVPLISFICMYIDTQQFFSISLKISRTDYYIWTNNGIVFYSNLVLIPCFLLSFIIQKDFSVNYAIRFKYKKSIWIKQSYYSLIFSFFFVIYQFTISSILGSIFSTTLINFKEKQSVFWFINQGKTSNISFSEVLIYTIFFSFFTCILFNIFHLIIKWFFRFDFITFVSFIILGICDIYGGIGICSLWGINYNNLLEFQPILSFVPILCSCILWVLGFILSGRKDLLHAK